MSGERGATFRAIDAYRPSTMVRLLPNQGITEFLWRGEPGDMVDHMVQSPQSCSRAFKTRVWFGKDNGPKVSAPTFRILKVLTLTWARSLAQLEAYVVPQMVEAIEAEKASVCEDVLR